MNEENFYYQQLVVTLIEKCITSKFYPTKNGIHFKSD